MVLLREGISIFRKIKARGFKEAKKHIRTGA
jgi:hypothetical protein